MKPILMLPAVFLLLASACKQDSGKSTAGTAPQTVEEYTRAIIKEVQQVILATDQQLREYEPQRRELPDESGVLQLWTEEGNPVRLTATTIGDNGQAQVSAFYFANGELFFAAQADAQFIFIGRQLKYWLDGKWKPAPVSEEERGEQERLLLEQAQAYLKVFD